MEKVTGPTIVGDGRFDVVPTENGVRVSIQRGNGTILSAEAAHESEADAKAKLRKAATRAGEKALVDGAFAAPWTRA